MFLTKSLPAIKHFRKGLFFYQCIIVCKCVDSLEVHSQLWWWKESKHPSCVNQSVNKDFQRQECVIRSDRQRSLWLRAGETRLLPSPRLSSCLSSPISTSPLFVFPFLSSFPYYLLWSSHLSSVLILTPLRSHFLSFPLFKYFFILLFSPHVSDILTSKIDPLFLFCSERFESLRPGDRVELWDNSKTFSNRHPTPPLFSFLSSFAFPPRPLPPFLSLWVLNSMFMRTIEPWVSAIAGKKIMSTTTSPTC